MVSGKKLARSPLHGGDSRLTVWKMLEAGRAAAGSLCFIPTIQRAHQPCPPRFPRPYLTPILLLIGSNVFMTLAWYGHLRFKETPLVTVIFVAWGIAFIEYCMAVPANRWGSAVYTTAQLKTIQEVITLLGVRGVLGALPERADDLELRDRICADRRRRVLRVPRAAVESHCRHSGSRESGCPKSIVSDTQFDKWIPGSRAYARAPE